MATLRITSILTEKTHHNPKPEESLQEGISETKSVRFMWKAEDMERVFQNPATQDIEEKRPVEPYLKTLNS